MLLGPDPDGHDGRSRSIRHHRAGLGVDGRQEVLPGHDRGTNPAPAAPAEETEENVVPQVPAMPLLRDMPEAVRALEIKEREIPEEEPQEEEDIGELAPRTPPYDVDEEDRSAREQIQARGTQELARAFGFGAAASRPVEQKPIALMDYSESSLGKLSA